MQLIFTVLACLVIFSALIPLVRSDAWWIRSFDFPRGQIVVLGTALLIAMLALPATHSPYDWGIMGMLALSLLFLIYHIVPYMPLAPKQALPATATHPENTISVLCANVLQSNQESQKLIALVNKKQPDMVLALECNDRWEKDMRAIEADYPYQVKHPLENTYGMLLYSRLPLKNPVVKFLLDDHIPSIFTGVTLRSGKELEVICLHPQPPRPDKMQDSTKRDAELLIVARYVEHQQHPVIVMGDFNDVAWSHTTRLFQRMSGLLDPRRGRGFFNTFHADYPFLRYPLDHIFHSTHFKVKEIRRLEHIGSDHFPVYVALLLNHLHTIDQEAPEPEGNDTEEAKRMIRNAFE